MAAMITPELRQRFLELITTSLADGTFVRLTLTRPVAAGAPKAIVRCVELKQGVCLSVTHRYPTRDVTKNIPIKEVGSLVAEFRGGLLCTTQRDWQLTGRHIIEHEPTTTTPPARTHDVAKTGMLDDSARDWLTGLGIMDERGKVRVSMADKYRQINRYLEIFTHLAEESRLKTFPTMTIADMGCGKGYLTFGVWHLCHRVWGLPVRVIGVEARTELVAKTNKLAKEIGADGLEFVTGTIESVALPAVDALIALHACDTATDDAIRRGIAAGTKLIVVAPCCHKEVRPQLGSPESLAPVLAHGIMAERMAEWATDGLRALFLEWAGYRTKVFEFVASEHTPKNLMIAAIRTGKPFADASARERVARFKTFFGIKQHALDALLTHGMGPG